MDDHDALIVVIEEVAKLLRRANLSPKRLDDILSEWKSEEEYVIRCPECESDRIITVRTGDRKLLMCEDCRKTFTEANR